MKILVATQLKSENTGVFTQFVDFSCTVVAFYTSSGWHFNLLCPCPFQSFTELTTDSTYIFCLSQSGQPLLAGVTPGPWIVSLCTHQECVISHRKQSLLRNERHWCLYISNLCQHDLVRMWALTWIKFHYPSCYLFPVSGGRNQKYETKDQHIFLASEKLLNHQKRAIGPVC